MATPSYRQSNAHFTYYNKNPKNSKSSGDCVIRAIAVATGDSWDDVYKELCDIGFELKRMPNNDKTYQVYLERHGWVKNKQPRKANNTKYTVQEFTKIFGKRGSYVVRVANHLTAVEDGKIFDTWDCGQSCVGNYWTKK